MNKNLKNKKPIILFLLLLLAFIFFILFYKPVKTVKIALQKCEIKVPFKGFYFTDEKVIYNGSINEKDLKYKNGELVPKNTKINASITAIEAGMLCTKVDGYEGRYNLDNINKVTVKEIEDIILNKNKSAGIKIVNSSEWYICVNISKEEASYFKKGMIRDINIEGEYYNAELIKTFSNSDNKFILIKVKKDLDITILNRGFNGYVIKYVCDGFIVPKNAIIEYNGIKGVFVKRNGYAQFKKVNILSFDKDSAVIIADSKGIKLKEYDEVILNPKGIENGKKVR